MERVVLLHGLGRTRFSMHRLERALRRAGFATHSIGYPSRSARVSELGPLVKQRIAAALPPMTDGDTLHLVGHSLGGILIRWLLVYDRPSRVGRVVLLAPPNRGSRLADFARPWLSWYLRPLPDLTTDPGNIAHTLPTPGGIAIGIIAGSRDRTVTLPETALAGASECALVPAGHSFLMNLPAVQELTVRFLRTGGFGVRPEAP
jgi:pimeloyl-ACP methyl ester carboxylesterase